MDRKTYKINRNKLNNINLWEEKNRKEIIHNFLDENVNIYWDYVKREFENGA